MSIVKYVLHKIHKVFSHFRSLLQHVTNRGEALAGLLFVVGEVWSRGAERQWSHSAVHVILVDFLLHYP